MEGYKVAHKIVRKQGNMDQETRQEPKAAGWQKMQSKAQGDRQGLAFHNGETRAEEG